MSLTFAFSSRNFTTSVLIDLPWNFIIALSYFSSRALHQIEWYSEKILIQEESFVFVVKIMQICNMFKQQAYLHENSIWI